VDAAARVVEDGSVVLERAIEPALVAELAAAVDRCMRERSVPFGTNDFLGTRTRRLFNLLAQGPPFERVPLHEAVLPVVERVLDPECLLSSLTAIGIEPGETAQPLHADDGSIPLPKPHVPITCTAIWALTDFTEANGGTRVVPGSQRADHAPRKHERAAESVATVMPAGSVLVYHGSLWHGGGANRTDTRRVGIAMNYCAGFMRQQENQQLGVPLARVKRFPARLQQLVGYGTYKNLIGHIDKASPSQRLLGVDDAFRSVWDVIK